jgi:hypothetical protein
MQLRTLESIIHKVDSEKEACAILEIIGENPEDIVLKIQRRQSEANQELLRIADMRNRFMENSRIQADLSKAQRMFESEYSRSEEILRFFKKTAANCSRWGSRPMSKARYRRLRKQIESA